MDPLLEIVLEAWMWSVVVAIPFMVMFFAVRILSTLATAMYNRICSILLPSRSCSGGRKCHIGKEVCDLALESCYDNVSPCMATFQEERNGRRNIDLRELPCQQWTPEEIFELWEEFYGTMCEEELDNLSNYSPR